MSVCVASGENLKEVGAVVKASFISMKMSDNCFWQTLSLTNHDRAVSVLVVDSQTNWKDKCKSIQQVMSLTHVAQQASSIRN